MKAWQILLLLGGAAYLYNRKTDAATNLPRFSANPSKLQIEDSSNDIELESDAFEDESHDMAIEDSRAFADDEEEILNAPYDEEDDDSVVVSEALDDYEI